MLRRHKGEIQVKSYSNIFEVGERMRRGSVAKAGARVVNRRTTAQAIWGLTDLAKTLNLY